MSLTTLALEGERDGREERLQIGARVARSDEVAAFPRRMWSETISSGSIKQVIVESTPGRGRRIARGGDVGRGGRGLRPGLGQRLLGPTLRARQRPSLI